MPKKRRADKKRKEKAANHHSTTNTQEVLGIDDLKDIAIDDQKEIDSEGGEMSSPKSQPDHRLLTENEEQGEVDIQGWDSNPSRSVVIEDSKSMEVSQNGSGNGHAENGQKEVIEEVEVVQDIEVTKEWKPEDEDEVVKDIQVARELKADEVSESKDDTIETVERDAGRSSSSSSSSSSDDESLLADKNSQVMESGKMEEEQKGGGSVMETTHVDSVEEEEEEEEKKIATLVVETTPDVASAEKLEEEREEIATSVLDTAASAEKSKEEGEEIATSVLDTATEVDLSGKLEEKNSSGSVMETAHTVDLAEPDVSLTEMVIEAFTSSTVVDTGDSNEIDLSSKDKEEISLPLSNTAVGPSYVTDLVAKESEDKMVQPSDAPSIETSGTGSAELPKEPAITEISENQSLVGTVPPAVERTCWTSCCGIFDVLRG